MWRWRFRQTQPFNRRYRSSPSSPHPFYKRSDTWLYIVCWFFVLRFFRYWWHMSNLSSGTYASQQIHGHILWRFSDDHIYIRMCGLFGVRCDRRHFQRLRDVKQLGTSHFVWPGATHTRFKHSLGIVGRWHSSSHTHYSRPCVPGVAYLSRLLASRLQSNQPELAITDRDVDCVEIAGLRHDLRHEPWSHVWDGTFIPRTLLVNFTWTFKNDGLTSFFFLSFSRPGTTWQHEQGSELMLDRMIAEYEIPITAKDRSFKALIAGDPSKCRSVENYFLNLEISSCVLWMEIDV